uniref:UPF0324 membrane protein n=1 Tax=uncultured Helicobacter sp. TaxID=175537 RepID=A0A650EMA6_9HELI|nr:UPF0324 membrane protein [uncultured Helicobacter sp.]
MRFSKGFFYGLLLLSVISAVALFVSYTFVLFLSPLIIGILLGALLSPLYPTLNAQFHIKDGIEFGAKKLLRLGIIFYGSYITLGEIASLGLNGFLVAVSVVGVIFCLSIVIGVKILKLDKEICMLVGIGSAVCGAAAILALESTLKTEPSKSSVALGFIVLFGLIGMILMPLVYYAGILPLSDYQWGVYIGASLHEVANVVGASAVSPESQNVAIIVKMTRVVLLVPLLFIISWFACRHSVIGDSPKSSKMYIPYFALIFLGVIVLHSLIAFPPVVVETAQFTSKLLLVIAMAALGLQIDWKKFVSFGAKTFILALILFVILLVGTYVLVDFMI